MESKKYIYLRFPVQVLKCDFYDIKKVCQDAMTYGIIEHMERNEYEGIQGFIQTYQDLGLTHGGFSRSQYSDQPKEEIDRLEELNYSKPYDQYRKTYDQYNDSIETVITCSIKMDLLLDFRNNEKSDFEIVVFRFFIALNSIKGIEKNGQGSWDRFFAVMLGYNTDKVLKHGVGKFEKIDITLLTEKESVIFLKYSTRQMKKNIKESLEMNWHLKWVSGGKNGIFFSWELGYKALETIKLEVIMKPKIRHEKLNNEKKKAKEEALKDFKNSMLGE